MSDTLQSYSKVVIRQKGRTGSKEARMEGKGNEGRGGEGRKEGKKN